MLACSESNAKDTEKYTITSSNDTSSLKLTVYIFSE